MSCSDEALRTVGEVEKLTGIPRRRVKYFIERGILRPSGRSESGYWLYSGADMKRLRLVWLCKELEYPDSVLKAMLSDPDFPWLAELDRQIGALAERQRQCENKLLAAQFLKDRISRKDAPGFEDLYREVLAIISGRNSALKALSQNLKCVEVIQ